MIGACVAGIAIMLSAVPSMAAGKTVRATENDTFSPASTSVAKGTKVTWRNPSGDDHNVTAYGNWSYAASLDEGQSAARKFTKAGTYKYRCTLHSSLTNGKCEGMCGKIVVKT